MKGIYLLTLYLSEEKNINFSKKRNAVFKNGFYLYIGSAAGPGGIAARVNHHLKLSERPHWHIDYFRLHADIVSVYILECDKKFEHHFAAILASRFSSPVEKFGSSDCNCKTHLFYSLKKPTLNQMNSLLSSEFKLYT